MKIQINLLSGRARTRSLGGTGGIGISERSVRRHFAQGAFGVSDHRLFMAATIPKPWTTPILSVQDHAEAATASVDEWGRKAYGLAQALTIGQNVPEFFVVTTSAFREFVSSNDLFAKVEQIRERYPKWCDDAFAEVQREFLAADLPESVDREMSEKYAQIGGKVSARSSSTIEDSEVYSFAGMYHTEMGVEGVDGVRVAVKEVFASLFLARVINYKEGYKIKQQEEMAVIIQKMVPNPKYAGVIYSPLPTDPTKIGIEYARDTYGNVVVAAQRSPHIMDLDNRPPYEVAFVDYDTDRNRHQLPPPALALVTKLVDGFKAQMPGAWDFEFCIDDKGELYLLQSRRITDVEPQAEFSIDEILPSIPPEDIIFEAEVARGITPREGIVCEVLIGETVDMAGIAWERYGARAPEGFASVKGDLMGRYRIFDKGHRGYALVLDHFPETIDDVDSLTPHKKAVITVGFAGRASHIVTIMRTKNKKKQLVYVGINDRKDLLAVLGGLKRVRLILDGYRALVLRAPEEVVQPREFRVVDIEPGTPPQEGFEAMQLDVELAGFDSVVELIEDLQAFLNRNGVEVEYDQFSEGRFGLYPVGDDWMIDVLDGRFIQVWLEAHKERAAQVIRLFNEYFGLSS